MDSTCQPPVAPLPAAAQHVIDDLVRMAGVALWRVGAGDMLAGLDALMEAEARLAGVRSRLIGEIESRGLPVGMTCANTRALLRLRYRLNPHAAKELDDLAYAAGKVFPAVGQALADGVVHAAQAQAIIAGLDKLAAGTSTEDRTRAQALLIDQASALDAGELRRAAARIVETLTVISEDGAPPADDLPDPYAARSVTFHRRNGGLAGRFTPPRPTRPSWPRSSPPAPDQPISAAEARRLACDAQLIPAVLGSAGQVLDVGRAQRLFGPGLRRVLALRDNGCSFPGCTTPPAGCDGHHLVTPWHQFGETCLANGTLLCPRHHRQIRRQAWAGRLDANGNPEHIPPAWIDPQQKPRQHHRFALRTYPQRT